MAKFNFFKELTENKQEEFNDNYKTASPGAAHIHGDSYAHYRLMMAAAGCSDKESPKNYKAYGPLMDEPFSSPYSKQEADIVNLARKLCGINATSVASEGSVESDHINKQSTHNTKAHKKSWRNLKTDK